MQKFKKKHRVRTLQKNAKNAKSERKFKHCKGCIKNDDCREGEEYKKRKE